jgi:hypothetical protein
MLAPVANGPPRTVLTASVPIDPTGPTDIDLNVTDWQAAPGSARMTRCANGTAPF